jgi:hypothetical protein
MSIISPGGAFGIGEIRGIWGQGVNFSVLKPIQGVFSRKIGQKDKKMVKVKFDHKFIHAR